MKMLIASIVFTVLAALGVLAVWQGVSGPVNPLLLFVSMLHLLSTVWLVRSIFRFRRLRRTHMKRAIAQEIPT